MTSAAQPACPHGTIHGPRKRRALLVALLALSLGLGSVPAAGQPQEPTATPDIEAEHERPAPVLLGGETVIWITTGLGQTPQFRADRISARLQEIVHDRSLQELTVSVRESDDYSELYVGPRLVMVVTQPDADSLGVPRPSLAQEHARDLELAMRAERLRYAPASLARSGVYGLVATLVFVGALWLIRRLARSIRDRVAGWRARRSGPLLVLGVPITSTERLSRALDRSLALARLLFVLLAFDLYLTYVLGLFPWTRAVSSRLLDYVVTPVRVAAKSFLDYLPNLLFVIVIGTLVTVAIRLVGLFFDQIRQGRLTFKDFPAEWADPTHKIVRVLVIAFGVVVAFPYLPASDSRAFAGVSVFMGILISLASSSSLSNMIAGLVLAYTGAFRLGERVKIGDAFGDIVETALLATRIRTIKNEEITIPNGVVLGSSVTNYSRAAKSRGLILHTSVTIGYSAPWRKVHELLLEAAAATPGLLKEPQPFVWQMALNDFYVTYEINAYTDSPRDVPDIYAELHARIQDSFHRGGVEIMSPHYTSLRDGNAATIPEPFREQGYRAPAFRVERAPSRSDSD